jgi:hypothetical protein
MPALVRDIVNAVINELSQVPGIATQVYASGRIQQHVQDALLLEIEEMWWPDYMCYLGPIPLDGTTGSLTQDLVGPLATITEYHDIAAVFRDGSNRKLRELPQSINPFAPRSGISTFYMAPDYTTPGRPFKVYPKDSTFGVVVWARQRPRLPLDISDTVYLDGLLLQYDACWMYAVDDGTIPAQVNKFQVLAQNRRRMIKAAFAQQPLELDPRYPGQGDIGADSGWDGGYFVLDEDPLA